MLNDAKRSNSRKRVRTPSAGAGVRLALVGLLVCGLMVAGCHPHSRSDASEHSPSPSAETPAVDEQAVHDAVTGILERQSAAWNRGDIDAFMVGYLETGELRFASGDQVRRGFEETKQRYYTNYPDRAAMGTLSFEDLEVTVLSNDAAVVFGRFRLQRESDEPTGLFTLVFRKLDDGWRIIADHTSSAS